MITRKETSILFEKLGKYCAKKLRFLKDTELLYREIAERAGLAQNRLSEIVQQEKINDKALIGLIEGGLVTVAELCAISAVTEKEASYLRDEFGIFAHREVMRIVVEMLEVAPDQKTVLNKLSAVLHELKESA